MKVFIIITILLSISLLMFLSCKVTKDFSTPINTLKTLQKSINRSNWKVASLCFTEEIRIRNQALMNKKNFYFMETGTIQSLLGLVPILSNDAHFNIKQIDSGKAIVEIVYPTSVEKDGRLKQLTLTKDNLTDWKVDKILWRQGNS